MPELRKHKRIATNLSCNLLCGNKTAVIPVTVVDVSFGGMATIVPVELAAGSVVEFQHCDFPFSHTSTAVTQCRVVSVRPAKGRFTGFRVGLAFEANDEEFVNRLLQWLQMQSFVQKKSMERSAAAAAAARPRWA